jgi:hypothetical protein
MNLFRSHQPGRTYPWRLRRTPSPYPKLGSPHVRVKRARRAAVVQGRAFPGETQGLARDWAPAELNGPGKLRRCRNPGVGDSFPVSNCEKDRLFPRHWRSGSTGEHRHKCEHSLSDLTRPVRYLYHVLGMESPVTCRKADDSYRGRSRWECC